jgi:hypothetical protein
MLKALLEHRRIRKTLGRYVSPDIARQLANGSSTAPDSAHTERDIEVAFIAISAPDAPSYSERAGIVAEIACQHGGIVHSLLPLVVVAFGSVSSCPSGSRLPFVASIQSRLPDAAAIVHGSITASVGSFGSATRLDFGFWWPGALDALRQLANLPTGHVHEVHPDVRNA